MSRKNGSKHPTNGNEPHAELQLIAHTTPVVLVRCGSDLKYKYINTAGAALFGRPAEEIIGRSIPELMGPDAFARIEPYVTRVLAGEPVTFETEIGYPAAGTRWVRVNYSPERSASGDVTGWIASIVDATDTKREERHQKLLFAIAEKLRTSLIAEDLLADIARMVGEHLGAHRCLFNEIDIESDLETVHRDYVRSGASVAGRHKISTYSSTASDAMCSGQTIVNRDSKTDLRTAHLFDRVYRRSKERAYIAVPMLREGRWVASLWVSDDKPRDWTDSEIVLAETIAERVWSAVERLRADTARRESQERFAKAFNASPLVLTITSLRSGRIIEVNDTFTKATGYSREEALGRTTVDLGLWADPTAREAEMEIVRTAGKLNDAEYVFRRRDGSEIIGLLAAEKIDIAGEPCALTVIQDITARKLAEQERNDLYHEAQREIERRERVEEALRESEKQIRLITDALPALISYVDRDETYIFVNRTYRDWFGVDPDAAVGKKIKTIFGAKAYAALKPYVDKALNGVEAPFEAELEYKNGPTRYVVGSYVPDIAPDGSVRGYFGLTNDITELKRSEEALREARDELELRVADRTRELAETNAALIREAEARLAGEQQRIHLLRRLVTSQEFERRRIARDIHDQLGQRLTGLRLKLASLRSVVGTDGDIAERVAGVQEICERLDTEVSFLAWELRPTALDDLGLVEALRTFVSEWSRHYEINSHFQPLRLGNVKLTVEIETHLYRITQEALNNIMKHADARNVAVMLEGRRNGVVLIIEDDGSGFDTSKLSTPKRSGKGLGLMGMRERAALIGGTLEVESSPAGTTIYVRVPTPADA